MMNFHFDLGTLLKKSITIFSAQDLPKHPILLERSIELIDEMGIASAKAQGLRGPVTTTSKLKYNPDHRIYIIRDTYSTNKLNVKSGPKHFKFEPITIDDDDNEPFKPFGGLAGEKLNTESVIPVGLLKVGTKSLYVVDEYGRTLNINPLCVLDFYIRESYQRKGYGKRLFEYMLMMEMESASHLAYDRPSDKFKCFLEKHYNLSKYIPQVNNFIVYKDYGLEFLDLDIRGRTANPMAHRLPREPNVASLEKNHQAKSRTDYEAMRAQHLISANQYVEKRQADLKRRPEGNSRRFSAFKNLHPINTSVNTSANASISTSMNTSVAAPLPTQVEQDPNTIFSSSRPVTTDKHEDQQVQRNQFYQRMSRDLSSTKTSLYNKSTPPSRELVSVSSRRSIKSPANDFASLSDYWLAQDQSRKTRVKSLYSADELAQTTMNGSNGSNTNAQLVTPSHHPSEDTSLYSPRQQSLLSTAEGLRKSTIDYGNMYASSPNYRKRQSFY